MSESKDKRGAALLLLLLVGGAALALHGKGGDASASPPPPPLPPPPPPPLTGVVVMPQGQQHSTATDYGVLVTFASLTDGSVAATWLTPDGRTAPANASWPNLDQAEQGAMQLIGAQYKTAPWPIPGELTAPHAATKGRKRY
jgi:hypothetical protein